MKAKTLIFFYCFYYGIYALSAQSPSWIKTINWDVDHTLNEMKADKYGNLLVIGSIGEKGDFAGYPFSFAKQGRIVFAKFDTSGNLKWIRFSDQPGVSSIEISNSGDYYFGGTLYQGGSFSGFPIQQMPQENSNGFVARCSPDGKIKWVRKYIDYAPQNPKYPFFGISGSITNFKVDDAENVCFEGFLNAHNSMTIAGKTYLFNTPRVFLVSFDSAAHLNWITFDSLNHGAYFYGLHCIDQDKNGNIYRLLPVYSSTGLFLYGSLEKFDNSGILRLQKPLNNWDVMTAQYNRLHVGNSNDVYIFSDTAVRTQTINMTLTKLDTAFNKIWSITDTGFQSHNGNNIETFSINKETGFIYLNGIFRRELDFGNLKIKTASLDTGNNAFIAKIDPTGQVLWIRHTINAGITYAGQIVSNLSIEDECNNFYVLFQTIYKIHFGSVNIDNSGNINKQITGFIAKYSSDSLGFISQKTTCGLSLINTSARPYTKFQWFASKFPGDSTYGQLIATTKDLHYNFPHKGRYIITLRGEKSAGCSNIARDTFNVPGSPVAGFLASDSQGCQYVNFNFADSSHADSINSAVGESWIWDFGDQSPPLSYSKTKRPIVSHIYTQSGTYSVKLVYGNGICTDTFVSEKKVVIIAAPKPGFGIASSFDNFLKVVKTPVADTLKSCAPLDIKVTDNSEGQVVRWEYRIIPLAPFQGGIARIDTVRMATFSYTFAKPGLYIIHQFLTGVTGCVTEDSVYVKVWPGISAMDIPQIKQASVTADNAIEISWHMDPRAARLELLKSDDGQTYNLLLVLSATDSLYLDHVVNTQKTSYAYKIVMIDSCGNLSGESRKAKTILLQGKSVSNDFAVIKWSPYEDFPGTFTYQLWKAGAKADSFPQNTLQYTDNSFYTQDQFSQCYTIAAVNSIVGLNSRSNTVCLPYIPVLWIPNAFSPNRDNHNDTFKIQTIGIAEMHIHIYNRWGEEVFAKISTFKQGMPASPGSGPGRHDGVDGSTQWDGTFHDTKVPEGLYIYKIEAKSLSGEAFFYQGTVEVIK